MTAIFPLPGCVLFPGVVLPLHLFEERYRAMMRDIVGGETKSRDLAIALLKPGNESLYETGYAPIHSTVCVGRILEHQQLPDGRYNLLLLGTHRAVVTSEAEPEPYRRGSLTPIDTVEDLDDSAEAQLIGTIGSQLERVGGKARQTGEVFERLRSEGADAAMLVDLISYHLIPGTDAEIKQRVLAAREVSTRASILLRYIRQFVRPGGATPSGVWPPPPSLN